jgi:hypothetical protein
MLPNQQYLVVILHNLFLNPINASSPQATQMARLAILMSVHAMDYRAQVSPDMFKDETRL